MNKYESSINRIYLDICSLSPKCAVFGGDSFSDLYPECGVFGADSFNDTCLRI